MTLPLPFRRFSILFSISHDSLELFTYNINENVVSKLVKVMNDFQSVMEAKQHLFKFVALQKIGIPARRDALHLASGDNSQGADAHESNITSFIKTVNEGMEDWKLLLPFLDEEQKISGLLKEIYKLQFCLTNTYRNDAVELVSTRSHRQLVSNTGNFLNLS